MATSVGQWHLKSKTGTLPTSLIVGIQASGGNGGNGKIGSLLRAGAGGGSGACAYFVLD